jgi:hypothetical protein
MVIPAFSFAESGYRSGAVEYVRVHDESIGPAWTPPVFWFSLEGVNTAGSCPRWGNNVLFVANNEYTYSMILAAYMSGKEVALSYDDSFRNSANYCVARHTTLGNPPPLR